MQTQFLLHCLLFSGQDVVQIPAHIVLIDASASETLLKYRCGNVLILFLDHQHRPHIHQQIGALLRGHTLGLLNEDLHLLTDSQFA